MSAERGAVSAYYVRGFKPAVKIVREHDTDAGAVYVVPVDLPWAGAQLVRRDALVPAPSEDGRR